MTEPDHKKGTEGRLSEAYNRMLSRVKAAIAEAERDARPTLHNAIENAKETATELEELTREEAERVAMYLRRDLREAGKFLVESGEDLAGWLQFDAELIERSLADMFWQTADQTEVQLQELALQADLLGEWQTGETTSAGRYQCKSCGNVLVLTNTATLSHCPVCGGSTFRRLPPE